VTRRTRPTLRRERALWQAGRIVIAGVDEVGRGPMAGPVVAAAVVLPVNARPIPRLNDSKVLSADQRDSLVPLIQHVALAIGVGAASVHEIDRLNIRRASILAMQRALARLSLEPDYILIDGLPVPELGRPHEAIVDGDARCQSIAAASVIAKTVRDRLMERLGPRHPQYRWEENKGYCTADHLGALEAFGPTAHHRRSFEPVSQLRLALDAVPSESPSAAAY
jgi:ribonuclease HII